MNAKRNFGMAAPSARSMAWLLLAALAFAGCAEDDETTGADSAAAGSGGTTDTAGSGGAEASATEPSTGGIEVAGDWSSEWGDESIDDASWAGSAVVSFDNDANEAITQTPEDDMYNPGKFNKIVWTEPGDDGFYYCTVDYGLDSADDAEASAMTADDSDPANDGCGGFSWTKLAPK
ncbi:MAG: hypothetical protein OEZ06_26385 [Myxococcales bacterium]|nr:hypothetical protein [Myxococcales bacterium]